MPNPSLPPANEVCEGYVFYRCLSFCPRGGVRGCSRGGVRGCSGGACMVCSGGGACMVAPGGACMVAPGGVCMVAPGGRAWLLGGMCGFIWGACVVLFGGRAWFYSGGVRVFFSFFGYNEIRSMRRAVRILLECISCFE